ncbi:MAG: hypothetical protein MZU84_04245 [Sphingobacterium sp.]|nr:hypothetical protein [Sphingobacterium sp.]
MSYDEVLELAKRSETAIYAIGIRSKDRQATGKGYGQADFALRQLTHADGRTACSSRRRSTNCKSIYALISAGAVEPVPRGLHLREPEAGRRAGAASACAASARRRHRPHADGLLRPRRLARPLEPSTLPPVL